MISRHCPYKPTKAERIMALHEAGKPREEIAAAVGCSIGYVSEVRRYKGLTPRREDIQPTPEPEPVDPNRADKLLRRFSWEIDQ